MNPKTAKLIHRIVRTGSAVLLGGGSYAALSAGGYTDGAETVAGIDAGMVRDAVTLGLGVAGAFVPGLSTVSNVVKSLTNDKAVSSVDQRLTAVEQRVDLLEANEVATTRKRS